MSNSRWMQCGALTLGLLVGGTPAIARDTYPAKPVTLVVGFSPGGGQDIGARIIAKGLGEVWGQTVVVANRAGANGMIATESVTQAAPDGYTVLLFTANDTVNAALRSKLPYDTLSDLAPVTALSSSPYVIGVHPSLPVKNARELIALAKAKPGQLAYASSGQGSSIHLSTELFKRMAGVDMLHVPYKGSGPALIDLVAGQVQVSTASVASFMQHIRAKRVRPIGVTGLERTPQLPEVPTVAESGLPGYEALTWNGIMVPATTPAHVIDVLNRDIVELLGRKDVREAFVKLGAQPRGSNPDAFRKQVSSEIEKWAGVAKAIGLRND